MKRETRSFYEICVQRTVEQIVADLDGALDLQTLARAAALSPYHFHRVFRGMVGETPLELHRRLRMERAAWTLTNNDTPVTAIAFAAGYETHESFTRAFRLHYGCSPSEFRQRARETSAGCARPLPVEIPARSGLHFPVNGAEALRFPLNEGGRAMNVDIKDMPALRVATLRHVGPYNQISEAFARLGAAAGPAGLFGPQTAMLGIYHDDPETTPPPELRSDAALVISPEMKVPPGLGEQVIPAGRYAVYKHVGPYEQLGDVWSRLMGEWLPRSGHRVGQSVSYEIYRNTPADVPKDKLETELYIPLV